MISSFAVKGKCIPQEFLLPFLLYLNKLVFRPPFWHQNFNTFFNVEKTSKSRWKTKFWNILMFSMLFWCQKCWNCFEIIINVNISTIISMFFQWRKNFEIALKSRCRFNIDFLMFSYWMPRKGCKLKHWKNDVKSMSKNGLCPLGNACATNNKPNINF